MKWQEKTHKGLNGANLKHLAIFFMAIDHIGAALIEPGLLQTGLITMQDTEYILYMVLRVLGRFSFPMFCFFLVEGFFHTHDMVKYLQNLLIFAVISEIPFDLALRGRLWDWEHQNVFFTLALGFIAIWIAQALQEKCAMQPDKNGTLRYQMYILLFVLGLAGIAELIRADYGAVGVAVIYVLYAFKPQKTKGAVWAWVVLTLGNTLEFFCFPFILAVKAYNGQRGKQNKYFFYLFYPAHLLVLYMMRRVLYG